MGSPQEAPQPQVFRFPASHVHHTGVPELEVPPPLAQGRTGQLHHVPPTPMSPSPGSLECYESAEGASARGLLASPSPRHFVSNRERDSDHDCVRILHASGFHSDSGTPPLHSLDRDLTGPALSLATCKPRDRGWRPQEA